MLHYHPSLLKHSLDYLHIHRKPDVQLVLKLVYQQYFGRHHFKEFDVMLDFGNTVKLTGTNVSALPCPSG